MALKVTAVGETNIYLIAPFWSNNKVVQLLLSALCSSNAAAQEGQMIRERKTDSPSAQLTTLFCCSTIPTICRPTMPQWGSGRAESPQAQTMLWRGTSRIMSITRLQSSGALSYDIPVRVASHRGLIPTFWAGISSELLANET